MRKKVPQSKYMFEQKKPHTLYEYEHIQYGDTVEPTEEKMGKVQDAINRLTKNMIWIYWRFLLA